MQHRAGRRANGGAGRSDRRARRGQARDVTRRRGGLSVDRARGQAGDLTRRLSGCAQPVDGAGRCQTRRVAGPAAAAGATTTNGKCGLGNGQKASGESIKLGAIVTKQPGTDFTGITGHGAGLLQLRQ